MNRFRAALLATLAVFAVPLAAAGPSPRSVRSEGFVEANGVHLQYLDWGGTGPALILLHGLGDNPYVFDDIAPAFTDRFHVIAYARRGCGSSDVKGPYDVITMTEDLRGLMDALGIAKAYLVGYSAAGSEITEMAAEHPERVARLIYFDGAYDWSDPDFKVAVEALPVGFFDPPSSAMASWAAYRAYMKANMYPGLEDLARIDSNMRAKVVIQRDGKIVYRTPREVVGAFYSALWSNKRSDYAAVHCPTLAIYAMHLYDLNITNVQRRNSLSAYEQKYWLPFQEKSIQHVRREQTRAQIVRVPGTHSSFFMTERRQVVVLMRQFLQSAD